MAVIFLVSDTINLSKFLWSTKTPWRWFKNQHGLLFFSPRKFVLKNTSWVPSHWPERVPGFDLSGFLNPGGPTSDWHLVEDMRDGIPNYAPLKQFSGHAKRWQMDAPFEKTVIGINWV